MFYNIGINCCSKIITPRLESESLSSVQFSQSCLTFCDPMDYSTPGLPVHHQLPEFTQPHVHRVRDAIQPSHPLSSPSPPAPNPSQHQGLFQWVNSSHEVAKVLEFRESTHLLKGNKNTLLPFPLLSPVCEQDSTVIVHSLRNILETSCRPGFNRMYLNHSHMPKVYPLCSSRKVKLSSYLRIL